MRIVATPKAKMLEADAQARAARRALNASTPTVIGGVEAARLLDRREFTFRQVGYRVPPTPWPLAAELLDVQEQVRLHASSSSFPETIALFERAAHLLREACEPVGRVRRALWPFLPNPFRLATPWEVGHYLGFFCVIQTRDPASSPTSPAAPPRGTSRPTSPASVRRSLRGSAPMATRSPGATS